MPPLGAKIRSWSLRLVSAFRPSRFWRKSLRNSSSEILLDQKSAATLQNPVRENLYRGYARTLRALRRAFPGRILLGTSLTHLRHSIAPEQERLFGQFASG